MALLAHTSSFNVCAWWRGSVGIAAAAGAEDPGSNPPRV
jgi:hypothetical protein